MLLGNQLGCVEDVELELVRELVVEDLHAEFPFGEVTALDGLPQIAAVKVWIGPVDLDRLVPHHRLQAQLGLPVELHVGRCAGRVHETERVNSEALNRRLLVRPGKDIRRGDNTLGNPLVVEVEDLLTQGEVFE